jgi:deoxyribodipyrimidine photolyase
MARKAFEQIPEIVKQIQEATKIVEILEEKVQRNADVANESKRKSIKVKSEMDTIAADSERMKKETEDLIDVYNAFDDDKIAVDDTIVALTKEIEELKKIQGENENNIDIAKAKGERANGRAKPVELKVDEAILDVEKLIKEIESTEMIDVKKIDEIGEFLIILL